MTYDNMDRRLFYNNIALSITDDCLVKRVYYLRRVIPVTFVFTLTYSYLYTQYK